MTGGAILICLRRLSAPKQQLSSWLLLAAMLLPRIALLLR
jgi:hypothetical protein